MAGAKMRTYFDKQYAIADGVIIHFREEGSKETIPFTPEIANQIGRGAFMKCKSLNQLIIPEGFEKIEDSAFHMCSGLKEVTIPATMYEMGTSSFTCCGEIEKINAYRKMSSADYEKLLCGSIMTERNEMLLMSSFAEIESLNQVYQGFADCGRPILPLKSEMGALFQTNFGSISQKKKTTHCYRFSCREGCFFTEESFVLLEKERASIEDPISIEAEKINDQLIRQEKEKPMRKVILVTFDPKTMKQEGNECTVLFSFYPGFYYWPARKKIRYEGKTYFVCEKKYLTSQEDCPYYTEFSDVLNEKFLRVGEKVRKGVYGKYILLSML